MLPGLLFRKEGKLKTPLRLQFRQKWGFILTSALSFAQGALLITMAVFALLRESWFRATPHGVVVPNTTTADYVGSHSQGSDFGTVWSHLALP